MCVINKHENAHSHVVGSGVRMQHSARAANIVPVNFLDIAHIFCRVAGFE